MKIEETAIEGVLLLTPPRYGDSRGHFSETWNRKKLAELGVDIDFVQDNHSISQRVGTLRGLHFQAPPHAQAKLVRCSRGRLLDVAVDIRRGSPTFGKWVSAELSAENGRQMLVPAGFAHGFVTREPETEVLYKCSGYYNRESEGIIRWDDPDLAVDWGLTAPPVQSEKDAAAPLLRDTVSPFRWEQGA
ncbi:MAG: dTDP-4-dehydrorhamnose 3,5-epimerase [Paracoccaceae bacterium]